MRYSIVLLSFLGLFHSLCSQGQTINRFAGIGTGACTGDGLPAVSTTISQPSGGAFDKYGNYYFASMACHTIRKIDNTGIISTIVGTGVTGFSGDGGPATAATLETPAAVKLDTFGNLYISDLTTYRIRKVDVSTGIITTIAGTGGSTFNGDNIPATAANIDPGEMCLDKAGNIFFVTARRLRRIDAVTGIITTVAGNGAPGSSGDGGPATSAELTPSSVVLDDTGNLYMGDIYGYYVRKVNTAGIISTIAGNGYASYSRDGIPATGASMIPYYLAIDAANNIFISDGSNSRVYEIDGAGIFHNIAGNGHITNTGDGGPATASGLCAPQNIATDPCGNLYISEFTGVYTDTFNYIRKITFALDTPLISISAQDTTCTGRSVTYTASATIGGNVVPQYKWYVNGTMVSTAGSSYAYVPSNGDSVWCVTSDICAYAPGVSNVIHMTVLSPAITLTVTPSAHAGSTVTVNATVTGAGAGYTIEWFNHGILFASTTTPFVTYIKTSGTDSISAAVITSASLSCHDTASSSGHLVTLFTTGIGVAMAHAVDIYPNPTTGLVTISASNSIGTVTITNLVGQTVCNEFYKTNVAEMNISALANGIYIISVVDSEGNKEVRKLVKE